MRELPPLPSPWDFAYVFNGPFGEHRSFSASHYNGQPCTDQKVLFTNDQMTAFARQAVAAEREQFRRLVLDDAWAMTFQTMGQYRTALAKAMSAAIKQD